MNIFKRLFSRKETETRTIEPEEIITSSSVADTATETKKVCNVIVEYTEREEEPAETTLKDAFELKYPKYAKNILSMFEAANNCPAEWRYITKVRLQRFVEYMSERLSPNSVHQYATKFKAVLNLYSDEVILPKGFAKILSPKKAAVQNVYLTEKEIQRIATYSPRNEREALVQAQFMIGVLTLARHSDFVHFDESNIVGDSLVYVSQKTHIQSSIPVSPTLLKFLRIQKELIKEGIKISDDGFNDVLKRICKRCVIVEPIKLYQRGETATKPKYEFVTSHTARRTGVTNLYLRGLDLLTISKIAGHTETKTTQGYICCGMRELPQEAKDYFTGF